MVLRREFTEARIRDTWARECKRADFSNGVWRAYLDKGFSLFEHPPSAYAVPHREVVHIVEFKRVNKRIIGTVLGTDISVAV